MPKVSLDGANRIATVLAGVTSINVIEDLYGYWKEWNLATESKYLQMFDIEGGAAITESQDSPTYFFFVNGWKLVLNTGETVEIGTNLYTKNPDGVICVSSNNSQITYVNSSAVQVQSELEKSLSYGEYIVYDPTDGIVGDSYPVGTHKVPSNNLADAISLANKNGVHTIQLHGNINIDQNVSGFIFKGISGKEVVVVYGVDVSDCYFDNLYLAGTLGGTGGIRARETNLTHGLIGVAGAFKDCVITGDITLKHVGLPTYFDDCKSLGFDYTTPEFIIGDDLDTDECFVHIRAFHGAIIIKNVNQPNEKFIIASNVGKIVIDSSCTDGTISIGGVPTDSVTDNSAGTTVDLSTTTVSGPMIEQLKTLMNQFNFNVDGDVKATLDGEEVTTDAESRKHPKTTIAL